MLVKKLLAIVITLGLLFTIPFSGFFFPGSGFIKLDQKIQSSFFDTYADKNLLIFFGYVGCTEICTPRLHELSNIYKILQNSSNKNPDVKVLFFNLSDIKNVKAADTFAKVFHPQFEGVHMIQQEIKSIKQEFNVYSAPSLTKKNQLDHSAFLYRLEKRQKNYYLTRIYTQIPFSESVIVNDIQS